MIDLEKCLKCDAPAIIKRKKKNYCISCYKLKKEAELFIKIKTLHQQPSSTKHYNN